MYMHIQYAQQNNIRTYIHTGIVHTKYCTHTLTQDHLTMCISLMRNSDQLGPATITKTADYQPLAISAFTYLVQFLEMIQGL